MIALDFAPSILSISFHACFCRQKSRSAPSVTLLSRDQLLYQSGTLSVPLPDTVVDPFQCFPFGKAIGESHFFYPCKESLYQKFDCHPVLMVYRIRCKKSLTRNRQNRKIPSLAILYI